MVYVSPGTCFLFRGYMDKHPVILALDQSLLKWAIEHKELTFYSLSKDLSRLACKPGKVSSN